MNAESEFIINKTAAYTIILVQVVITILISLLLLITAGKVASYSALLGGGASIGPVAFFARCAFRYSAAQSPDMVMKWFMIGEIGKLILTALIFAVCIVSVEPLTISVMFATFLIVMMINLIGLVILNARK